MRAPLLVLALALSASASLSVNSVAAADDVLARYESSVKDLSPASTSILEDTAYLTKLKAVDPRKADDLRLKKAVLRELQHIAQDYQDPDPKRAALAVRVLLDDEPRKLPLRADALEAMGLGPEPEKAAAWIGRNFTAASESIYREAAWNWETMSPEIQRYAVGRGAPKERWDQLGFRGRQSYVSDWAEKENTELLKQVEKTTDEKALEALGERYDTLVGPAISNGGRPKIFEIKRWELAARAHLTTLDDPKLRALLDQASDPRRSDPDRLSALSKLYDGSTLGRDIPGAALKLRGAAPPPPYQQTRDQDRDLLQDMLPGAYMKELRGTTVGDRVIAFYGSGEHPLKLHVQDHFKDEDGAYATYDPEDHVMHIRIEVIEKWLRVQGKGVPDLMANRDGTFQHFIEDTAPIFVHEAVHQMQDAENTKRGMAEWITDLKTETNARFLETAFAAEQWGRSATLRDRVKNAKGGGSYGDMRLEDLPQFYAGPRRLEQETVVRSYSTNLHYDLKIAADNELAGRKLALIQAELARRKGLDAAEQAQLAETGITADGGDLGLESMTKNIRRFMTSALEAHRKELEEDKRRDVGENAKRGSWYRELDADELSVWKTVTKKYPAAGGGS